MVRKVFPYGIVEIESEKEKTFKVNDQRLKPYLAGELLLKGVVYSLGNASHL